jgi:hypothetical protein
MSRFPIEDSITSKVDQALDTLGEFQFKPKAHGYSPKNCEVVAVIIDSWEVEKQIQIARSALIEARILIRKLATDNIFNLQH